MTVLGSVAPPDPTKIRVRLGSCGVLGEGDGVAESGEPFGVVAGETVGVQPLEVVAPEFTIRLAVAQDVEGDDEDAVGDSDDGLLIAAPLDEAAVLGREVGVAFAYGAAGTRDQGLGQGAVGVPSTATQPLARALMVARAEAGPGGRMARRREPRHVEPSSAAITSAVRRATPGMVSSWVSASACGAVR